MNDKVDLAEKLATFHETFQSDEGAEILLIESIGTPNTGDSRMDAAPEVEV